MTAQEKILTDAIADVRNEISDLRNIVAVLIKGIRGATSRVPALEERA
jgi:hypothetical protein